MPGPRRGDQRIGLGGRRGGLVDGNRRRRVAAPEAGGLGDLDLGVRAVALPQRGDALVRPLQPAGQVVAGAQRDLGRRLGAEVRVERDQSLDLIQRPPDVPGQRLEFLARQPAEPLLDGVQRRDQAGAGELARPRLDPRHPRPGLRHHRLPVCGVAAAGSASLASGAASIRTAQNLNSGILPQGSISSIVSRFAAASRKWNGMKQLPRASRCETRTASSIVPRRELTLAISPSARPSSAASSGFTYTSARGLMASSAYDRRVIEPVCQCCSSRPVFSTNGYSRLGSSLAGSHSAGTRWASPSSVLNRSPNITTVPSLFSGSGFGYSLPVSPRLS